MEISFSCKTFEGLTKLELYEIMVIRQEVFVVEQDCPYLDADGLDHLGRHILGTNKEGKIIAYTRIFPKGVKYRDYTSITRVLNHISVRGKGMGQHLMSFSIQKVYEHYGSFPIKISAQCYLERFYQSFGFRSVGASYLEDGIPHIAMVLPKEKT